MTTHEVKNHIEYITTSVCFLTYAEILDNQKFCIKRRAKFRNKLKQNILVTICCPENKKSINKYSNLLKTEHFKMF